jgi:lincosamide nucleotidyltransferase A/C/D/E
VIALLDLLATAEVPVWVAGGWGVDALLDRQTRRHCDIDLVIADDGSTCQQVAQVLAREDFRLVGTYHSPGIRIPWCHVWHHDVGHTVEVLPVPLNEPPFAPADVAEAGGWQPFTEGRIEGRPVPCLSAELQLLLHSGYPLRETDTRDIALLNAYLKLPTQATTR